MTPGPTRHPPPKAGPHRPCTTTPHPPSGLRDAGHQLTRDTDAGAGPLPGQGDVSAPLLSPACCRDPQPCSLPPGHAGTARHLALPPTLPRRFAGRAPDSLSASRAWFLASWAPPGHSPMGTEVTTTAGAASSTWEPRGSPGGDAGLPAPQPVLSLGGRPSLSRSALL